MFEKIYSAELSSFILVSWLPLKSSEINRIYPDYIPTQWECLKRLHWWISELNSALKLNYVYEIMKLEYPLKKHNTVLVSGIFDEIIKQNFSNFHSKYDEVRFLNINASHTHECRSRRDIHMTDSVLRIQPHLINN